MKRKVILLGLPKCGLMSFTKTLTDAGYNVAFWKNDKGEYIGELIMKAHSEGKPLFHYLSEYDAFTQLDAIDKDKNIFITPKNVFYKEIYEQNKEALFILNYRDIKHHADSMRSWRDLAYRLAYFGITDIEGWIEQHNTTIRNYFKDKNNFIEFDIEHDNISKVSKLLKLPLKWFHLNKTIKK
jgi:hypothetical protein